jgi:hypothetical protein
MSVAGSFRREGHPGVAPGLAPARHRPYGGARPPGQGNLLNRRIAGALAALALVAAAPAATATASGSHSSPVVAAKPCSSGYVHAVVPGGAHKCLRAGEFCSHRRGYARVYRHAGYRCARNGHLVHR